ncbi:hypothetical protein BOVA604_3300 [Bacteroides ovatus]|nr:hypothetical protein BOVA604_3300 [Bacteroides ovatus]
MFPGEKHFVSHRGMIGKASLFCILVLFACIKSSGMVYICVILCAIFSRCGYLDNLVVAQILKMELYGCY